MKLLRIILLLINLIVGLGALAGGYACLVDPVTPLGATIEMLQGSPFSTFLIPGDCSIWTVWSRQSVQYHTLVKAEQVSWVCCWPARRIHDCVDCGTGTYY